MLYIAADHPQPERAAITEYAAIRDINELEQIGSTKDLDIVVQIDRKWPGYPERYWLQKAGRSGARAGSRRRAIASSATWFPHEEHQ
jgi:hypothetical protein